MSQATLWDKGGLVSNEHPSTSHHAAATVKAGSQRAQVLMALWKAPATAHSLWTNSLVLNTAGRPVSPNQIATRLKELRDGGLVEYQRTFPGGPYVVEDTTSGNTAMVQALTGHGRFVTADLMRGGRTCSQPAPTTR